MANFQQDPLDLQTSDVKYYLGKITGAGNIGTKNNDGDPLEYFNNQDIGVLQSSVILQDFNTSEFVAPPVDTNQAWVNYLNQLSDTTSLVIIPGQVFQNLSWTSGLPDNRQTEKKFLTELLSYKGTTVDLSAFGGPPNLPFGDLYINAIKGILSVANPSLPNIMPTPDDMWDTIETLRDNDDAFATIESPRYPRTSKFPRIGAKNLYDSVNQMLGSSYEKQYDIIYNKSYGDFNAVLYDFIEVKDTVDAIVGPVFDTSISEVLGALTSNTPYTNLTSGVIGNYQDVSGLNLTGIEGYPTGYVDGKYLRSTTTGVEYVDITDPVLAFTGLTDTPSTITPNEYLRGSADGQSLIYSGVSFLEDVIDRPVTPQSGYLQLTPAGNLVWAAGTTSGDITYNFTGSEFFTGLQDTPSNYDQFKFLRSALNGIEYVDINGGVVAFTGLDGSPSFFTADKYLKVNSAGNSLEYADIPSPILTFTGLTDTPSSFTNASGQYLRINSAENAVEFVDISGEINSQEINWNTYLRYGDLPHASDHAGMFTYVMIDSRSGAYVSNGTNWVKIDSDAEEGATAFTGLSDTPNSYDPGKYLQSSATGLEWVNIASPTVAFTGLTDTPSSYSSQSGKYLVVSNDETGVEFKDLTFYTGAFVGFGGAIVFKGLDTSPPSVGWNDRNITNLVGASGIKNTYLDNHHVVLPKGKYLINAEGGVNCDSASSVNPAPATKIGIEFTSGDYAGQTFDSFSNRGPAAGSYGQIRGSVKVVVESENPIKFKVKSHLPSAIVTPSEYSFSAAQTDVSILDLGASKDFLSFTGLLDVPSNFNGASGKFLQVSDDETELEYSSLSGQISSQEINWNVYATPSDLPDASDHHGMFAHVHSEDAAYMAHAGQWEKIYPQSFTGLSDTPSSLTADKYLKVNSAGDGFVFADGGGGGDPSGCCNTIKIRKNDADTPTSAMAASAIDYIAVKYANHWGTWGSWQYANLDDITDGDPNTYWRPTTNSSSVMYQFILKFKDDIHINAIQWSGDPWWGRLDEIESSSSKKYDMTSATMYAITPFTSQNLGEITTKATTGVAVSAPWGTTNPSAVPVLDFTNLGGDGKVNRMYWQADDGDYPTPAGGINPKITDIKLAYSLTDPSTLNYIVERPFASGISASTNATIYLQRGQSYTFDIESDGNPFYIKTANSAGTSDLFSAGVTNNGVTEGNLTFQVPYDAPETLYYVSSNVPTLSGMIKILAADGGSHGGGGSTTGVTGVESLGAGSELASGVSGSDLYLKSLVGGTNVTLSSDDNTITINAAGGGGGGGTSSGGCVGENVKLKELTSFSGDDRGLPDAILLTGASDSNLGSNWTALMKLGYSNLAGTITYNTMGTSSHSPPNFYIRFHDNASASFDTSNLSSVPTAIGAGTLPNSISGFVKSGYGIYYCGGAGSGGGGNSSGECSHSIIHLQSDITNDGVSGIWDKSPLNNNTIVNGVVNSTTQVHRGNSSFYYDGVSPLTNHIEIGTCEFIYADRTDATIESWIYWDPDPSIPNENDDCLVACVSTTTPRDGDYVINFEKDTGTLLIIFGGKGAYRFNLTDIGVPEQTWFHLAFCNHQGVQKIYIDGVGHNLDSITPVAPGSWGSREGVYIGHWNANGRYEFRGYLQDFRITRGKCVYTENFTPPSDLLPISCGGGGSCSSVLNYQGQYIEGTSYKANDFVTYNGKSYIATSDNDGSYNPEGAYLVTADVTASNTVPTIPISYDPYGNPTFLTNGHPYFNNSDADVNLDGPASSATGQITGLIYPTGTGLYVGLRSNQTSKFINFDNIKIHRGTSHVLYNWDGTTTSGWNARVNCSIVVDNDTLKVSSNSSSSIYVGTVLDFASEINGNPWSLLAGEIAVNNCNAGGSTTGITGASNIGTGSGVFSGISDNDLVFRTIEAGPNVSITESSSGLKISASTNVTVTGGSVSGGVGSNPFITGASNFYTNVPDQLILEWAANSEITYDFYQVYPTYIEYLFITSAGSPKSLKFDNDSSGTWVSQTAGGHTPQLSLSGYIASGRAVYFGGGGSSAGGGSASSVSGGVNSNPAISALSNFTGILPDRILLQNTNNPVWYITFDFYGIETGPSATSQIQYRATYDDVNNYVMFDNDSSGKFAAKSTVFNWISGQPNCLQDMIDDGLAIFAGGGGSGSSSSSTTGITGVESLGAGSELASGVSDRDLYLKSLVGGTNVTLSSDDNTITINAAGGGGSSTASGTGIGNSLFFEDRSNYYSRIPDEIIFNGDTTVSDFSFSARLASVRGGATNPEIRYDFLTTNGSNDYIRFNNNAQGTYNSTLSAGGFSISNISGMSATDSLSGLIESGIFEPVYYNLGGSSTGGGAGGSGGIGSNPYVTGASNFYTTLPDVILAPQVIDATYPQGKWNWPLYLSFVTDDPAQTQGIRYVGQGHSSTAYTFFENDLSGTTQGSSAVIDNSISSLSGYIASGRAVYFGGGSSSGGSSLEPDCTGCGIPVSSTFTGRMPTALIANYYWNGGAVKYKIKIPFHALGVDGDASIYFETYNTTWQNGTAGSDRLLLKFNDDASGTVSTVTPSAGTWSFPDTTRTLSDYIASGDVVY